MIEVEAQFLSATAPPQLISHLTGLQLLTAINGMWEKTQDPPSVVCPSESQPRVNDHRSLPP
jgi:hypothetical protein